MKFEKCRQKKKCTKRFTGCFLHKRWISLEIKMCQNNFKSKGRSIKKIFKRFSLHFGRKQRRDKEIGIAITRWKRWYTSCPTTDPSPWIRTTMNATCICSQNIITLNIEQNKIVLQMWKRSADGECTKSKTILRINQKKTVYRRSKYNWTF